VSKVASALKKDLSDIPKISKQYAQETLNRINRNLIIASEEIIEAGYHVDMETSVGDNGLFIIKFVVND